mgnify:CR=1 FL=1
MELIGKQPEFKESFKDTSAYEKKGWKKYVWILDKKDQDFFAKDIYEYRKNENSNDSKSLSLYITCKKGDSCNQRRLERIEDV